jgi:tetratricopeptide (TPR) repeat protein
VAKNKGKYHGGETPELAPNEELLSFGQRIGHALRPHAKKIAIVAGGVAVILIAIMGWSVYDKRRATQATKQFTKAIETAHAEIVAPGAEPPDGTTVAFASEKERSEATLAMYDKLIKSYGGAKLAKRARLLRAGVLFDLERWDESIKDYQAYLSGAPDDHLRFVAREGLGYAQEARALAMTDPEQQKQALGEALATFEKLQPKEDGYYYNVALYHQARIRAAMGERDKAVELYKRALEKTTEGNLRVQITNRLAALEEQS